MLEKEKSHVLKKSGVAGSRPSPEGILFGELALNYSNEDPGLFFKDSTRALRKVGPTNFSASGPNPPFSQSELWLDTRNNVLKICADANEVDPEKAFIPVRSLLPTGDSRVILYVSPEDSTSSDSFENDGTIRPFKTLNRAVLEIYRQTLGSETFVDDTIDRYTILLVSGDGIVSNSPGDTVNEFDLNIESINSNELSPIELKRFNPVSGGLVLPKGASIIGVGSSKSILRPDYLPPYSVSRNFDSLEFTETSAERLELIKVTGSSSVEGISIRDKKQRVQVLDFEREENTDIAIFNCSSPHGLLENESVNFTRYSSNLITIFGQDSGSISIVSSTKFKFIPEGSNEAITFEEAIEEDYNPQNPGITIIEVRETFSHHLISGFGVASKSELEEVYGKVRKFFSTTSEPVLGFQIFDEEFTYSNEEEPSFYDINIDSRLGMSGFFIDGNKVEGTRSVLIRDFSYDGFQEKAFCYEVQGIINGVSNWQDNYLVYSTSFGVPTDDKQVFDYIFNEFDSTEKRLKCRIDSFGRPLKEDCRNFGIRADGLASVECYSSSITHGWPAFWAREGSRITSIGCNIKFGIGLLSEGFSGLGTISGSDENSSGYLMTGIVRSRTPLPQEERSILLDTNSYIESYSSTVINLVEPIDKLRFSPYVLNAGDIISVVDISGTEHFTEVVSPVTNPSGDEIYINDPAFNPPNLNTLTSIKVVKKLEDRDFRDWTTKVRVRGSNNLSEPPRKDQILRLSATGVGSNAVKSGVQLDPVIGGWNTTFIIGEVIELPQEDEYELILILGDDSRPYLDSDSDFYTSQHTNLEGKTYITDRPTNLSPPNNWNFVKSYVPTQTIDESFQGQPSFNTISITNYGTYDGSLDTLTRGVQWKWNSDNLTPIYSGFSLENEPSLKAVRRLLRVFGYTENEVEILIESQDPSDRFIEFPNTGFFPSTNDEGFLQTDQYVPVEFNQPSTIICVGTSWFESGFFLSSSETKGYISERESQDALATAIFGGDFVISGIRDNESQVLSDENTLIL